MADSISGEALHKWRDWATELAKLHCIDPYEVDWLLQGLTTLTSTALKLETYLTQQTIPTKISVSLSDLTEMWQQRTDDRVPVQYLVGETPWRNLTLTVTPDVLIPRPETELIADIVQQLVSNNPIKEHHHTGHWADLGTGSGAIALSLAAAYPHATIHATDISPAALAVAKHNAKRNNLGHNIKFYKGSWLTPLSLLQSQLSGIVTNPPYIPSSTVLTLDPEVSHHEPHLALDGGPTGLESIKKLIKTSEKYLMPGGIWLTELMDGQAEAVSNLLDQQKTYTHITSHRDLAGISRFVSAYKIL